MTINNIMTPKFNKWFYTINFCCLILTIGISIIRKEYDVIPNAIFVWCGVFLIGDLIFKKKS